METELTLLRREVRILKLCSCFLSAVVLVLLIAAFRGGNSEDQVIRARGLIIVDAAGHERILIGAPIPTARNRVRTDSARVRQIWGPQFPKEYLTWYRAYRHGMNGMLVLDEQGFDRVAVGDSVPDPNIGKRIGPSTGVVINDSRGFERTGYGLLHVDGSDRVVLGLDNNHGSEALSLAVFDSGPVGIHVQDGATTLYLGRAPSKALGLPTDGTFAGLLLKDGAKLRRLTVDSL